VGSQGEDPKVGMLPTLAGGSVATPTDTARDATVASYDRGLPQVSPARFVQVQTDLYQRLGELARGGLGRISTARDVRTGRVVAVKEMLVNTEDAAVRFAREALITANLEHPAIVPVYEVGRWPTGEPFFAMKLVKGRPLNAVIDEATDLDARLALISHVLTVADALAYAHGERVIHRDLKPHNVLCGAHGETVVIDWGLARRLDEMDATSSQHRRISAEPGQTYVGAIMGTPAYMPPEQARGKRVDERADVYAIGAILYHVLAGAPAYAGRTLEELLDKVKAGPPRALAEVVPAVPPDLAAIVTRAMAPDPAHRYPTAAELATDLRRFTTGQLVLSHRYTTGQRISRFVAQHRAAVSVAAIAFVGTIVGSAFAVTKILTARDAAESARARAESETTRADTERDEVRRRLIAAHVDRARIELAAMHPHIALAFIVAAADIGGLDPQLEYLAARSLALVPGGYRLPVPDVRALEFIPGSHDVVVGSPSETVRWNPETDHRAWTIGPTTGDIVAIDAARLLVVRPTEIGVHDAATGAQITALASPTPLRGLTGRDRSGRWFAAISVKGMELFDTTTTTHVASIPLPENDLAPVVSPDGQRLAVGIAVSDVQNRIAIVERSGRVVKELCGNCRVMRPAATGLVVADYRPGVPSHVAFYDWSGAKLREIIPASVSEIDEVVETPDGASVAIFTTDGAIEMHTAAGLRWRTTVDDRPFQARIDPAGHLWVIGAYNGAYGFDVATGVQLGQWALGGMALRVSDDGAQIAVAHLQMGVRSWRTANRTVDPIAPSDARVRKLLFDGDRIITASDDGLVAVYEAGKPMRELGRHTQRIPSLQLLGDGSLLSSSRDNTTVIREISTGRVLESYAAGPRAGASADGVHLAIGQADGTVQLIDRKTKASRVLGKMTVEVAAVRWAPDGSQVAALDDQGRIVVWSADGVQVKDIPPAQIGIELVWSFDSKWLGRIGQETRQTLFSTTPGVSDLVLEAAARPSSMTMGIAFAPDGKRVAIADQGKIRLFGVPSGALETTISTGTEIIGLTFSSDGRMLYGGGLDHKVRAWDVPRGVAQLERSIAGEIYGLAFDDRTSRLGIMTLSAAMVWNLPPLALELPKLRALVACLDEHDPVTGTTHPIDVTACNRLSSP
jgi:WD40 repeat protein